MLRLHFERSGKSNKPEDPTESGNSSSSSSSSTDDEGGEEDDGGQSDLETGRKSNPRLPKESGSLRKSKQPAEHDYPILEDYMPASGDSPRASAEPRKSLTEPDTTKSYLEATDTDALLRQLLLQSLASSRKRSSDGETDQPGPSKKAPPAKEPATSSQTTKRPADPVKTRKKLAGLNKTLEALSKKIAATLDDL